LSQQQVSQTSLLDDEGQSASVTSQNILVSKRLKKDFGEGTSMRSLGQSQNIMAGGDTEDLVRFSMEESHGLEYPNGPTGYKKVILPSLR